ncbi:MAG: hypothetical protein STHCBS139747_002279 [Sporothrix thermara]
MFFTVPPSSRLFQPLKLGNATLQHRIALAPATRLRGDNDNVPLPIAETYYADRACMPGTLIISESAVISRDEEGIPHMPGISSDAQVAAWARIIDAVHAKSGIFFLQLAACGRMASPAYLAERGIPFRSCSDVPVDEKGAVPRPMTVPEIQQTIQDFVQASKRAVAAGADGVEIHAAHGSLLDQFLSDASNKRTDEWGGSVEKRSRLTLDIVRAVVDAIGAERVAVRFSPYAATKGTAKSDPHGLYSYLVGALRQMNVPFAYLSLVATRGDAPTAPTIPGPTSQTQTLPFESLDFIVDAWDNLSPVVIAGGYLPESACFLVDDYYKKYDVIVAFGRRFIANPDLVFRIRNGIPLNEYDRSTFYQPPSAIGYNDYPFCDEFLLANPM